MVVGVTGCPGSGKSVLAGAIVAHGWLLVDADDIGREVVEGDIAVLDKLREAFGSDILDDEGRLKRRLVAQRAFPDLENIRKLNSIVHPKLVDRLKSRIEELRTEHDRIVVDCALIFEWRIENLFDVLICVQAHEQTRKERIMKRDDRSSEEVEGIFSAQLPEREKVSKADIVIGNNSSIEKIMSYGLMLSELPRYFDKL